MLPFLKRISSSNYVLLTVCNVFFLKIESRGKKWMEKQQHITTATLSQSFPLHRVPTVEDLTCPCKVECITMNSLTCCLQPL